MSPGGEVGGAGRLGIARILFGSLVLLRTTPVLAPVHISNLQGTFPLLGWPTTAWHVPMWGPAIPAGVVAALCVARTIALLLFTAGIRARESGIAAGVLAWTVLSQDAGAYINTFHLLFMGLVILGASGAGGAWALWPEREVDAPSGLALTRVFAASVYAWSGFAKVNGEWLRGQVLERLHDTEVVRGPLVDALLTRTGGYTAVAWMVAATELALGPLLLWPRTRRGALIAALAFHAALQISVRPDFFGFAMAVLLLAFVERGGTAAPPAEAP